jgi:hypothetical protein
MKRTVRTTIQCTLFAAALAAPLCFAGGAKAEPRTHDGLYLSLDTGLGYLSTKFSVDNAPGSDATLSGITVPFEVLVGGTVGPVAIGGGFLWDQVFSPSVDPSPPGGTAGDVTLHMFAIHAFADFYPDPHGGFHVRPFLGYAGMVAERNGVTSNNNPGGPIFGAGVGYDFWVADEWSIGVMGRFAYAPLSYSVNGISANYSTIDPAILATFTFQ